MAHWTGDTDLLAALHRLPAHFQDAIDCDWLEIGGALSGETSLFILGRGPSTAIAAEAALKFKETCAMHAEAYSAAEVMHGPLALVGPGFPVLALAARDASEPSVAAAADALAGKGAAVFVTSRLAQTASMLPHAATGHPLTDPLALIVSFYSFVEAFAVRRRPQSRPAAQSSQGDGDAMSDSFALAAPWIFDGEFWLRDAVLMVRDGLVEAVIERYQTPYATEITESGAGMLAPGFVDLQVNGGGGVMLNDHPSLETIETICRAHAQFGTTALLATLITDTPETTAAAIAAGARATDMRVPGFLGLHLEGPHLSTGRKGAHDPQLIRPMSDADQAALIEARQRVTVLLTTVAPESVSPQQIAALAGARIIVSLGHSDASYAVAVAHAEAGATVVTHLFNAMSQMAGREPGLVGAALDMPGLSAGLIADGFHVDAATHRDCGAGQARAWKDLSRHRRDGDHRHRHDLVHAERPDHQTRGRPADA